MRYRKNVLKHPLFNRFKEMMVDIKTFSPYIIKFGFLKVIEDGSLKWEIDIYPNKKKFNKMPSNIEIIKNFTGIIIPPDYVLEYDSEYPNINPNVGHLVFQHENDKTQRMYLFYYPRTEYTKFHLIWALEKE
jgi:hypothetical protein